MNRNKLKNKGFTLIELLVVVSIISLLSSIVFASLNNARMKARNAQRVLAAKQVQNALELYYSDYGYYPASSDQVFPGVAPYNILDTALIPKYISSLPTDPKPGTDYAGYHYYTAGASDWYAILLDKEPNQSAASPSPSRCYICNGPPTSYCGTNTQMWGVYRCQ